MRPILFHPNLDARARALGESLITHVLDACDPQRLLGGCESCNEIGMIECPTHVIAFGKASIGMSEWCVGVLGSRFAGGVALGPESILEPVHPGLRILPADHPEPTQRNIDATRQLIEYARSIPTHHACIVCISGGGSAHLCSPMPGVTLAEIIETTRSMNTSGAPIGALNRARSALETLKGGGLRAELEHLSHTQTLILSDVLGDDTQTIASGPMGESSESHRVDVIGNHLNALESAEEWLAAHGVRCPRSRSHISGDSRTRGRELARVFIENVPIDEPHAAVFVGETTTDARGSTGIGGPCMQCALSCAHQLSSADQEDWMVIGLATDGIDGPTDAAGAVIRSGSVDPTLAHDAINAHNALGYLDQIGASFRIGPTGTNVNDLVLAMRI